MPTHITAEKNELAPYVLIAGDPDRCTYIAETYFDTPRLYTEYRKMYGYTGTYKGIPVSVQAAGMGAGSCAIIVEELIMLGAKAITRVGTCGGLQEDIPMADVICATAAWSSGEIVNEITECAYYAPAPDFELLMKTYQIAQKNHEIKLHIGPISSEQLFYSNSTERHAKISKLGCLAVEMEAAYLFAICAKHNVKSTCLLTVSDLIYGDPANFVRASDLQIRQGTDKMVKIALDSFVELAKES